MMNPSRREMYRQVADVHIKLARTGPGDSENHIKLAIGYLRLASHEPRATQR